MASLLFNVPGEQPKKVEVTWDGKYRNLQVFLDGEKVSKETPIHKNLKQGIQLTAPDNHIIGLKYFQSWMWSQNSALEVTWDGTVLQNSGSKDNVQVKDAMSCTGIIALIGLLSAILLIATNTNYSLPAIIIPVIYIILWLFIRKSNSTAMIIFTVVYFIETVLSLFNIFSGGYPLMSISVIPGMILRLVVVVLFIQAVNSMIRLRKKKQEQTGAESIFTK